jgi:hypothetical protein
MKRRVRERVVGVCVEDDGEEVDGVGRELIVVVVVGRSHPLAPSGVGGSVTAGVSHCHQSVT